MFRTVIETSVMTTALCVAVYYVAKTTDCRGVASVVCDKLSHVPTIESDLAKDAFTQIQVNKPWAVPGHTHGVAAGLRSSATSFARRMAAMSGAGLYIVGMSRADQRKSLRGSRAWFWIKDVNARAVNGTVRKNDIEYICDVDYYIDMPTHLGSRAKPTLLYTVVPESATSNGEDDTTFYFTEDGCLNTLIAGSGKYIHHLWDYSTDSLLATDKYWFGIPKSLTAYAVERKQVSKHRQLILLTPMRSFTGFGAILAYFLLEGQHLTRFLPIWKAADGSTFIRFLTHTNGETCYTTARPGTFACCTVPARIDDALATVARLGTTRLQIPTVKSWLGKDQSEMAAVLTEFHRSMAEPQGRVYTVFPVNEAVRAYSYDVTDHDQERTPKLTAFMSPLVHGAFSPTAGPASEVQCVEGRINKFKREEPRGHDFRDECMVDFAREIMYQTTHLTPVAVSTVEEKQSSPAQQISLRNAFVAGPHIHWILKCFIKAEAYPDPKDPRCISTYNDSDKLTMSQFALALSAHLKQFKWYGPGKTPKEIATRVAEICEQSQFVNLSDYHRMDGTITYTMRMVDHIVTKAAFPGHCSEVSELLKHNAGNPGRFPEGTKFDQGPAHGSGCPATSVYQTLRATFCSYLAFRNTVKEDGSKYSSKEAFAALGLHLGDDGIDGDLPVNNHEWAAKKLGLVLEAATIPFGERGVNFLARYYSPLCWTGSPNSMCDIKRQLAKFHTTVRLPDNVTAADKLVEKAMSYVATDGNTPVMGALCKRALSFQATVGTKHGVGNWWSKFAESEQYPNENVGGWMDTEFNVLFPQFDRSTFNEWISGTEQIADVLKAPLCAEIEPPTPTAVDVIVDGDVLDAKVKPEAPVAPAADPTPKPDQPTATKTQQRPSRSRSSTRSKSNQRGNSTSTVATSEKPKSKRSGPNAARTKHKPTDRPAKPVQAQVNRQTSKPPIEVWKTKSTSD